LSSLYLKDSGDFSVPLHPDGIVPGIMANQSPPLPDGLHGKNGVI
jgi:hypothetical protein